MPSNNYSLISRCSVCGSPMYYGQKFYYCQEMIFEDDDKFKYVKNMEPKIVCKACIRG
jgi:hypothetical protein